MSPTTKRKSKWELVALPSFLAEHQGLPAEVPAPPREADRVKRSGASHGEMARWLSRYASEAPDGENNAQLIDAAEHMEAFHKAGEHLSGQQFEAAADAYGAIVDKWGSDRLAKLNLAQCRNLLGKSEEALVLLNDIAEHLAENVRYIVIRSRVLQNLRKHDEMIDLLTTAYKRAPNNNSLRQEMVRVGELVPAGPDPKRPGETQFVSRPEYEKLMLSKLDELLAKDALEQAAGLADFHLESNMPASALVLANRVLEKAPEQTGALTVAGLAQARLGHLDEAEKAFRQVLEINDKHVKARIGLGSTLIEADKQQDARGVLESVLADEPQNVRAAEVLLLSYEEGEERNAAAQKLREQYPDSWVPVKLLGDLAFREGDIARAYELHQKAFDQQPADDTITMILHDLDRLGKIEEAVRFAERIPGLERRSATVRWNTANVLLKGGRIKPAIAVLEAMTKDGRLPFETRHSATLLLKDIQANVRGRH